MTTVAGPGHLFLSYSTAHRGIVSEIAGRLVARGVPVFMDALDDTLPGQRFLDVLESRIVQASGVAVFVGPGGLGQFERLEVNLAVSLSVQRGLPVVPVLLKGAGHSELRLFLQCFSWIDLREGLDDKEIDKLARITKSWTERAQMPRDAQQAHALADLIGCTQRQLTISGHTLDRFTQNLGVKQALLNVIAKGAKVTVMQLNPDSPYAAAHRPFHDRESGTAADRQYGQALNFFLSTFHDLDGWQQQNIDVSFSNYMPRFRAVLVDEAVYVYFYMYGVDVSDRPDVVLEPTGDDRDLLRRRIIYSINRLTYAPEAIPLIRSGQSFPQWRKNRVARWGAWDAEHRRRHTLTHDFYVANGQVFHDRFGSTLERHVKAHLEVTTGRTLVLGCGSGKEVEYILRQRRTDHVRGIDFSHVAIDLARQKRGDPRCFLLGDFYDLDHLDALHGEVYDSVVANAALVHLDDREDIDEILRKARRRMANGGVLFLRCLYKEQHGRPVVEEVDTSQTHLDGWGAGRWFVYYSRAELIDRCQRAGLIVDSKATERIARTVHGASGQALRVIMEKGFPHTDYGDVYWPCVIARNSG